MDGAPPGRGNLRYAVAVSLRDGVPTKTPPPSFDALLPAEMANRAVDVGQRKAELDAITLFALAVLAGAFVALGAVFSTTVFAGAGGHVGFGIARLLAGIAFSLGLVLVVVGGAELFTGNNLIVMAWAARRVSTARLLRNWIIVYLGNFTGAVATAGLVYFAEQYRFGDGVVGKTALDTANLKAGLGFWQAIALGVLCNALVCLAVWLSFSARSTIDRVVSVVFPVSAFVAAGFEHSIANMYFVPFGLLVKRGAPDSFWTSIQSSRGAYADLTWRNFLVNNLIPVTIGNVIGGAVLVGGAYWLIYLRKGRGSV
ncbi:MAG: formate transporter FocA [Anaerolineaceae bacterium]